METFLTAKIPELCHDTNYTILYIDDLNSDISLDNILVYVFFYLVSALKIDVNAI